MPQVNGQAASSSDLDSTDYNPIEHLNAIFSRPSSLASISSVSRSLQRNQEALDKSISQLVAKQAASDAGSIQGIQAAQAKLAELFKKIDGVQERALQTEQTITEMTADIKRLDGTKRNLTMSMTALKRLQMLTTAYEQLRGLAKTRQYKECSQLLGAVIQLMAHFRSYRSIDQIAALSKKVAELQRELLEQVCEDFENAFSKGEVSQKKNTLSEACGVIDALGDNARARLITWYCNATLKEYRQIFRGNDEAGSLDNISRRFAWFNRTLKTYDHEHLIIFPANWRVNEQLANAFCAGTREDFRDILQKSVQRADGQTLDVNLLLSCLQETLDFEHALERRFASARASTDTMESGSEKPHAFEQAISEAFEPYLSLWVDAQDRHLATLIPKYRIQALRNPDEEFSSQLVIPSSTELFQFYRLTLAQCAKLSTGGRLLELSRIFAKYLDQYSQQTLFYFLADRSGPQGPSIEEVILILNTADYCYLTCNQLEEKIKARIDDEFRAQVDLQSQADAFMGIAGAAIRALVRKVELDCESGWREMRNTGWSRMENTGDQSSYVAELLRHIKERGAEILKLLHKQQYARAFCDNLVDSTTNSYLANVIQCKPISEVGAEQMLLDFYVLKKVLTEIPMLNASNPQPSSQSSYAKRVAQTTAKIDPLLKTLQVRPSPPEALVQAYLIHIADRSEANFKKILELKGLVRKQDQTHLIELFNAHKASHGEGTLATNSHLLTSLQISGTGLPGNAMLPQPGGIGLGTASKFDPASFGSAILSAAKDGVDRFGTPASAAVANTASGAATLAVSAANSAAPSRVASPPQGAGTREGQTTPNLNDNLRSIGKFFKRDMSTFGRFGGQKNVES